MTPLSLVSKDKTRYNHRSFAALCCRLSRWLLLHVGQRWKRQVSGSIVDVGLYFGSDCTNRLGHGDEWPRWKPTQVAALADSRVAFVACGPASSAAIDASGQLYLWGDNFCGQLFPRAGRPDGADAGLEVMQGVDVMMGLEVMLDVTTFFVSDSHPFGFYCPPN